MLYSSGSGRAHGEFVQMQFRLPREAVISPYVNQRAEYNLSNVHAVSNIHLVVSVALQSAAKVHKVENILKDIVAHVHLVLCRLRRPPFDCLDSCIG